MDGLSIGSGIIGVTAVFSIGVKLVLVAVAILAVIAL